MGVGVFRACHHGAVIARPVPTAPRTATDRCPGLLRVHLAADGALIRLRLPGGRVTSAALAALARIAAEFGNGEVQLTSRGNVQLRGVAVGTDGQVPAELVARVVSAGLLPSVTHELVRNITCSPLTGRVGGLADLRPLVTELDELICSTPRLSELPGRFLFGLDDGSHDIAALACDLGVQAVSEHHVALLAGGAVGPAIPTARAAACLIALAEAFLCRRGAGLGAAWHVRELAGGGVGLLGEVFASGSEFPSVSATTLTVGPKDRADAAGVGRYGRLRQQNGRILVSFVVPLGLLTATQLKALSALSARCAGELIVTPWRGIVVPDVPTEMSNASTLEHQFDSLGLSLDPESGWRNLSACTGAPGCSAALGSTRPIAERLAAQMTSGARLPVHVIGCERRCGAPQSDHLEARISTTSGTEPCLVTRSVSTSGSGVDSPGIFDGDLSLLLADAVGYPGKAS